MANKTAREKIIETLKTVGIDVKLQGSYESAEKLPDNFATYFIPDSQVLSTYNNKPFRIGYMVNVNYYSKNMSDINTKPDQIFDAMIAAGFTADGVGYDAGLDKETGRYGWLMDFYYTEERSI